ncbi:MAG: GAF domain-containing sensor histidine kinase, partial [Chloroflexota bacterium]
DERTGRLYYRVQRGLFTKYTEDIRISLGEGIAGRVAQTGESILLEDISKEPHTANLDLSSAEGLRGFVSIPLKVKDKVVGVMNVASHVAGRFGADDVSLLNSIGDYLGTTIEQARLYERLARVGERNRVLLQYALTAQEQERKRIARELHDETSQSLTSLTLNLQALIGMAEMKGMDAEFINRLKSIHAYTVHASYEIVQLMKELRPTLLDELGMAAAINRYARSTLEPQGIEVSTEFEGTDQRFAPEIEVTLFRFAQGAVGNIVEHAKAKNVSIKLRCDAKECVLEIQDDGKGFDVSKLTQVESTGRGAGLFIMRERTSMLGGAGFVESAPGRGTKVIAKVPINMDVTDEEDKSAHSR